MKTYDEIKEIITNQLGIKTLDDYYKWLDRYKPETGNKFTLADIELLSPDNIDNGAFWRVAEELFGTDGICPQVSGYVDTMAINRANIRIAQGLGMVGFVDGAAHYEISALEIGPGYGWFKNYVEVNTRWKYTGVDVYPRILGIEQLPPNGLLSDEQKTHKYQFVFSSNVFQHLSQNQRSQYFKDIHVVLDDSWGYCAINFMCGSDQTPDTYLAEDGHNYLRHYGQLTRIPLFRDLCEELETLFDVVSYGKLAQSSLFGFVLHKKKIVAPTPAPESETAPITT